MKNNTSASEVYVPKEKKGLGIRVGLLLMALVVIVVVGLYLGITYVTAEPNVKTIPYNGYFLDVNGDGKLDYVVSSEVIINDGNLNLSPSP